MTGMRSTSFPGVVAPRGSGAAPPQSAMGSLARRRPLLTLKPKRLDDGGVPGRDVDVAAVDRAGVTIDKDPTGGFLGSPEMGVRGAVGDPNFDSGLIDALDSLGGQRSVGGLLMDEVLGERELSFNPMTGKFDAERDWGRTAFEKGAPMMFGPLGPLVSLGMRGAREGYGTSRDNPDPRGGADMADGGRVRLAGGGVPAGVQALMMKAMQSAGGGAPGGPPQGPGGAPAEPPPFRFIPDPAELARRYGGGERMADGALAAGRGSGLIRGPGDGRSDSIDAEPEPDGYVIPAAEVAMAGGGSTEAGAERIARDVVGRPEAASAIATVTGGGVPARLSNGEMYLDSADVKRAGGHGALDSFVRETRKRSIKSLKNRPGPRR